MTDPVSVHDAGTTPTATRPGAGAMLRAAREGAGLSVDAVAQQLKLAPRQVRAIEDADHAQLPGRTFVRGFVRNYARLVRLDIDTVLAALPDAAATQETPSLQPPAADMGELPAPESTGLGWTRWAIPAAMIAVVAALALYEFMRPAAESRRDAPVTDAAPAAAVAQAPVPAPASNPAPTEPGGTPLSNPVTSTSTSGVIATPGETTAAREATPSGEAPAPAVAAPAPAVAALPAPTPATPPKPAASTGSTSVVLAFRDYSWTEARDRHGVILMSRMNPGGSTQTITGDGPLDFVIGNATDVTVTFKGARVDLVPYTRQNVARLTLR